MLLNLNNGGMSVIMSGPRCGDRGKNSEKKFHEARMALQQPLHQRIRYIKLPGWLI